MQFTQEYSPDDRFLGQEAIKAIANDLGNLFN